MSLVGFGEHKITGLFPFILVIVNRYHPFHCVINRGGLEHK
jgi:hypothetical protein